MIKILITSAGGSGSNNLLESIRLSKLGEQIYSVGTHADKYELICSNAEANYLVPYAEEEDEYIFETKQIVEKEKIDVIIPNSDKEVAVIARNREKIENARIFLPEYKIIESVQDKYSLSKILRENEIPVAETLEVEDLEEIEEKLISLPNFGRFWIRVKTGAGSIAATWVKTSEQAKAWIKLWQELQGIDISQFIISEFLPGKDYAVNTLWSKGRLLNAKICERLSYFYGEMRLSGMASTPKIAKTVNNKKAIATCVRAIERISEEFESVPNGIYEIDMKENSEGVAHITEINIGRFAMISPVFDRTGEQNTAELYLKCALGLELDLRNDPYDIEPDILMVRGLDKKAVFCKVNELDGLAKP